MTRKDFELVSREIARAVQVANTTKFDDDHTKAMHLAGVRNVAEFLADAFGAGNTRFERTRFMVAAGFDDWSEIAQ